MQNIFIRRATIQDMPLLVALARKTYSDAFGLSISAADLDAHLEQNLSLSQIAQWLNDDVVLVAEWSGKLVGYVQFGNLKEKVDAQELRRLYVLSEFQNQYIGTQLIHAALAHPQMQNAAYIDLDVWEHNHGAQRFYERFGFEIIGAQKFQVASGAETDSDLIMRRSRQ